MQVTLNALPASLAEFQNLPRNTPEEVVAGFLCALHLYTKNPNEGVEAMNLLRGPRPMTPYDGQIQRRLMVYAQGSWAAGMRMPLRGLEYSHRNHSPVEGFCRSLMGRGASAPGVEMSSRR